jgi:hypothetical protein
MHRRRSIARLSFYRSVVLAIAALLVGSRPAAAEPLTFAFEGVVTSITDGPKILGDDVIVGAPFFGTYTFDAKTPPRAIPTNDNETYYDQYTAPSGIEVFVGDLAFRTRVSPMLFAVIVRDEFGFTGADEYQVYSGANTAEGLHTLQTPDYLNVNWQAGTYEHELWESLDLPLEPPNLALLGGGDFFVEGECGLCGDDAFFLIRGTLTSLTLATTEPTCDLTGDGRVDRADVARFVGSYGRSGSGLEGDFDNDDHVGLTDLVMLQAHLSPPDAAITAAAVPEPSALALAAGTLGTYALSRKLRRGRRHMRYTASTWIRTACR